jgi:hypothetical protein
MEDDEFRRGAIDIQWLERRLASLTSVAAPPEGQMAAVIAAALLAEQERMRRVPPAGGATPNGTPADDRSAWRQAARREGLVEG